MTKLKDAYIDRQYKDFRQVTYRLPFVSDGKAIFYAGDSGKNMSRAKILAKKNDMTPISQTDGGKFLNQINTYGTFGEKRDQKLWDQASRKYASLVKGEIKTFVAGASYKSTFRRIELPSILNNKNVAKINGIDRSKLDQFRRQTFERLRSQGMDRRQAAEQAKTATHRKVAIAEIRQDRAVAKQTKDMALRMDANDRLKSLIKQHRAEPSDIKLGIIKENQEKRQEFRQERQQKLGQLKQDKQLARDSGDRSKIIAAQKNATAVIKELRVENSKHAVQAGVDQKQKAYHSARLDKLNTQSQQKAQTQSQAPAQNKSQMTPQERTQAIYNRAQQTALNRGASPENAKLAAETRVNHVTAKMELNKGRAAVQQAPTTKAATAYVDKSIEFRDKRIADLQAQAKREDKPYQGPPQKSPAYRAFEKRHEPDALVSRSTLNNRHKAGEISDRDYSQQSHYLESKVQEYKSKDYEATFGHAYSQRSSFDHSHSEPTSFTPYYGTSSSFNSASYNQPTYSSTSSSPTTSQSQGHTHGMSH